jgi:hypothetical protein
MNCLYQLNGINLSLFTYVSGIKNKMGFSKKSFCSEAEKKSEISSSATHKKDFLH